MLVSLKYGTSSLELELADKNYQGTLEPSSVEPAEDPLEETRRALASPIGSKRLKDLASAEDKVVILASDITRPSPSHILIPPLLDELNIAGVKDEQIKIIFGLGIHRQQTEAEMIKLVGEEVYRRVECIDHDGDNCQRVGVTSRGTPVMVFREVLKADLIIGTANLEYHYFAGFSGGAKSLCPGVCSRETIKNNHQLLLQPGAVAGNLKGNPVREDIEEAAGMVGVDFIANAILSSNKELVRVVAGDVREAHLEGTRYIDRIFGVQISELADIVITSPGGFPKDIDLYQAFKAMDNARMAVKEGGIIITAAECSDGLGEDSFASAFEDGLTPEELVAELEEKFILGRYKASRMADIHLKHEIYLVSNLSEEIREQLFLPTHSSLEEALKEALGEVGKEAKILVMPYGISTLPRLK